MNQVIEFEKDPMHEHPNELLKLLTLSAPLNRSQCILPCSLEAV